MGIKEIFEEAKELFSLLERSAANNSVTATERDAMLAKLDDIYANLQRVESGSAAPTANFAEVQPPQSEVRYYQAPAQGSATNNFMPSTPPPAPAPMPHVSYGDEDLSYDEDERVENLASPQSRGSFDVGAIYDEIGGAPIQNDRREAILSLYEDDIYSSPNGSAAADYAPELNYEGDNEGDIEDNYEGGYEESYEESYEQGEQGVEQNYEDSYEEDYEWKPEPTPAPQVEEVPSYTEQPKKSSSEFPLADFVTPLEELGKMPEPETKGWQPPVQPPVEAVVPPVETLTPPVAESFTPPVEQMPTEQFEEEFEEESYNEPNPFAEAVQNNTPEPNPFASMLTDDSFEEFEEFESAMNFDLDPTPHPQKGASEAKEPIDQILESIRNRPSVSDLMQRQAIGDTYEQSSNSVSERLAGQIYNLSRDVGINDRYVIARALFDGDVHPLMELFHQLDMLNSFDEAVVFVTENCGFDNQNSGVQLLVALLKRRFSTVK